MTYSCTVLFDKPYFIHKCMKYYLHFFLKLLSNWTSYNSELVSTVIGIPDEDLLWRRHFPIFREKMVATQKGFSKQELVQYVISCVDISCSVSVVVVEAVDFFINSHRCWKSIQKISIKFNIKMNSKFLSFLIDA